MDRDDASTGSAAQVQYGCKLAQDRTDSLKMLMAFHGDAYTLHSKAKTTTKNKVMIKKINQRLTCGEHRDAQNMLLNGKR